LGATVSLVAIETAVTQVRPKLTLAVVCIGYAMVIVDTTIVNVALPAISAELGTGLDALQWIVDGYVLVLASLLLSGGVLVDRIGSARMFQAGVALFTVASVLCGVAPTSTVLVVARLLQGLAAAMLIPASMALLALAFPDQTARARAIALFTTVAGSPQAFGPVVGGLLVTAVGWRSIFFINVPIGVVTLVLAARGLPPTPAKPERKLDWPGQLAVIVALAAIAGALIEGHARGWLKPLPTAAAVVAVAAGTLFVIRQRTAAHPMLPAALLKAPRLASYVGAGLLLFAAYYGIVFTISLFLQQVRHESALITGLQFLPSALPVFLLPLASRSLATRWGARRTVLVGLSLAAAGAVALLTVGADNGWLPLSVALLLLGCGVGLTVGPQITLVIGTVPGEHSGTASGLLNAGRQTGYVLGVAVLGSIASAADRVWGLRATAIVAAVVLVLAAVSVRNRD
jgi:DHA2 family methylenomycin A resistance protein-like MFS transporter